MNERGTLSPRQSASAHQVSLSDLSRSYIKNHLRAAIVSLQCLLSQPIATLMTLMVLAIAITLPCGLYLGLKNIQSLSQEWQGITQITLYLAEELSEPAGRDLAEQLAANDQVKTVKYLSKAQALEEFKLFSGFSDAVDQLDQNPLPAVILLEPQASLVSKEPLSALQSQLQSVDGVAEASVDMQWLERLLNITQLAQRLVLALASLLALAVVLVVGNTIRLEIENRRDEIQVVKLVGGTDAFVRRPFLYTGFWYGIAAGLIAAILVQLGIGYLDTAVIRLASLYQSAYQLQGLGWMGCVNLVVISILVGIGGAWLAVLRHLKAIEP